MSATAAPPHRSSLEVFETAVAGFGAAVLILAAVLWADRSALVEMTDFSLTYVGAKIVQEHRGRELYDLSEQASVKSALFQHPQPLIFEHPPFEALLFSPLGGLSYRSAYLVWGFLNALIWIFLPCLLRPYLPVPRSNIAYISLWLLFAPLGVALYQGQSSLLVLFFLSLSFIALKKKQELKSGLWLGMTLFKFQFAIPFALIFLLRRKWAMTKGFAITGAALILLSFAAVGRQGVRSYLHLIVNVIRHPHNVSYGATRDMATLQGFLDAIFGARLNSTAIHLIAAAVSVVLILCVAKRGRRPELTGPGFDLLFAAAIVVALLSSGHMFTHDMSPLVLASFLVAAHLPQQSRSRLRFTIGTALLILWIPPLYFTLVAWHCMYLLFPVLLALTIAALLLAMRPRASFRTVPSAA